MSCLRLATTGNVVSRVAACAALLRFTPPPPRSHQLHAFQMTHERTPSMLLSTICLPPLIVPLVVTVANSLCMHAYIRLCMFTSIFRSGTDRTSRAHRGRRNRFFGTGPFYPDPWRRKGNYHRGCVRFGEIIFRIYILLNHFDNIYI